MYIVLWELLRALLCIPVTCFNTTRQVSFGINFARKEHHFIKIYFRLNVSVVCDFANITVCLLRC